MKYFAALLLSAVLFVACGDESSSSAPAPDPSEESSSSVEKTKESSSSVKPTSSEDKQYSSTKKEDSSSSVVKSSSSKNKSSSSVSNPASSSSFDINAPCTYGDIYIEEFPDYRNGYICYEDGWKLSVEKTILGMSCPEDGDFKRNQGVVYECVDGRWQKYEYSSSSSAPKSSSSRGYQALRYDPFNSNLSYGEFADTRDGTKYATIDIDNKYGPDSVHLAFTVFAQNLKYHDKMVLGSEEQDDDTKVEMYCYNDSIEYCNDWWGGLYQWAEMMALPYECNNKSCADLIDPDGDGFHQGICPKGWHVITQKEMLAASYTSGGDAYFEDRMSSLASEISYSNGFGNNTSGMSFLAAGYRNSKNKSFAYLRESTVIDYAEECPSNELSGMAGGVSKSMSLELTNLKINGASVRCVKDY